METLTTSNITRTDPVSQVAQDASRQAILALLANVSKETAQAVQDAFTDVEGQTDRAYAKQDLANWLLGGLSDITSEYV